MSMDTGPAAVGTRGLPEPVPPAAVVKLVMQPTTKILIRLLGIKPVVRLQSARPGPAPA